MPAVIAANPMATPATSDSPGRWERAIPPAAPMNMAGKGGPPRKAGQCGRIGQALAEQEQDQGTDRVVGAVADQAGKGRLAREEHVRRVVSGELGVEDREPRHDQTERDRREDEPPACAVANSQGEPPPADAED